MANINKLNRLHRVAYFPTALGMLLLIASVSLQAEEITQQYLGLTINANLELADGKSLEDGVVLILHGGMAHNRMEIIEESQQALLDNDQSSLAINLSLGIDNRHGFYDCSWPFRHILDSNLDEFDAWVAWLREKGVDRTVIMAHSFGANQAMVYAVERKHPAVTHLILLAPNTNSDPKPQYEARYGETFDENLERVQKQIDAGKGDELIDNLDFSYCPQASVSANSFYSVYRLDNKFRQFPLYLSKMPIPTLIVTGTRDELQPNIERDVAPFVDGSRIRLAVVENAGHFFRDFNIEEAVEAAVEFIAESE
jgi:pimeloyl-ACP methyl ester carboxylesterase